MHVVALALAAWSLAATTPSPRLLIQPMPGASAAQEDIVVALDTEFSDRVGVHFAQHAAVYFLLRSDPAFAARLDCARESLAHGSHVKFSYAVSGQVLNGFECAHKP